MKTLREEWARETTHLVCRNSIEPAVPEPGNPGVFTFGVTFECVPKT